MVRYGPKQYLHAEAAVIVRAKRLVLHNYTLVSLRAERKATGYLRAKPCEHCESLLRELGVGSVWYTDATPQLKQLW